MLKFGEIIEKTKYSGEVYFERYEKIKKGRYVKYMGNEYKLICESSLYSSERNYYLFTKDKNKLDKTFSEVSDNCFQKKIDIYSLEYIYDYIPYVLYGGEKFLILRKLNNGFVVDGTKGQAEKFGFQMVDKGVYDGWMPASEVDVIEEKQEAIYYPD